MFEKILLPCILNLRAIDSVKYSSADKVMTSTDAAIRHSCHGSKAVRQQTSLTSILNYRVIE